MELNHSCPKSMLGLRKRSGNIAGLPWTFWRGKESRLHVWNMIQQKCVEKKDFSILRPWVAQSLTLLFPYCMTIAHDRYECDIQNRSSKIRSLAGLRQAKAGEEKNYLY